jgi:hypothetical protein
MALPIVQGSEVQTQVGATKIDPSAFRRAALAKGEVLSGAGTEASKLLEAVGDRMQQVVNTKHVVDADIQIKQFNQQQEEALSRNPNPSSWSESYNQNFQDFKNRIMSNPLYGPQIRNHISNMLDQSQANTDISIRTAANKKIIGDTRESIVKGSELDIQNLHGDEALKKYTVGLHSGVFDQAQYDMLVKQLPKRLDVAAINNGYINDPIHTYDLITQKDKDGNPVNFKNITGTDRVQIENQAREKYIIKQNLNQRDFPDELAKMQNSTAEEKISYIQKKEQNKQISSRYAETATRAILQQDKAFQTQIKNDLKASALMFIKPNNPDNEEIHKLLYDELGLIENPLEQAETAKFMDDLYTKAKQPSKEEATAQARAIRDNKTYLYTKAKRALEDPLILPLAIKEDEIPYNGVMDRLATIWNGQSKTVYRQGKFAGDYAALKKLYSTKKEQFEADFGVGTTPTMVSNAKKEHTDQLNDLIRTWADNPANANDAADRTKVDAFWKSINKNYMMEQTRQALGLKQAAAKVVRIENPDQIKDLPRGTRYEYQGTIITK